MPPKAAFDVLDRHFCDAPMRADHSPVLHVL
jgi:hypothetical protein